MNIIPVPIAEADELIQSGLAPDWCICITDTGRIPAGIDRNADNVLSLIFKDTDDKEGPSFTDVKKIIDLSSKIKKEDTAIVCCNFGRGRTSATTMIMLCVSGMNEDTAIQYTKNKIPRMSPNEKLLELGDTILGTVLLKRWKEKQKEFRKEFLRKVR